MIYQSKLTSTESTVLALYAQGFSRAEIAAKLQKGDATVRSQLNLIRHKLGLKVPLRRAIGEYFYERLYADFPLESAGYSIEMRINRDRYPE